MKRADENGTEGGEGRESDEPDQTNRMTTDQAFLFACDMGNIAEIERLLTSASPPSLTCKDSKGRNALTIALERDDIDLMEFLVPFADETTFSGALLDAINENKEPIACVILQNMKYDGDSSNLVRQLQAGLLQSNEEGVANQDITPMMLAAQRNLYEVVRFLYGRGEIIERPHSYRCTCEECVTQATVDQLRFAQRRLNGYKALVSESYLSIVSDDPLQDAFTLCGEMKAIAKVEKHFKAEYMALAEQLSEYLVKLLDRVREQTELEAILNHVSGSDQETPLARLKLAIGHEEKKFVAHPNCQMKLVHLWYEGAGFLEKGSKLNRIIYFLATMVIHPFLMPVYIISPNSKLVAVVKAPVVKFCAQTAWFLAFLGILVSWSLNSSASVSVRLDVFRYPQVKHMFKEDASNSGYYAIRHIKIRAEEYMIFIWVMGFLVTEMMQLYKMGFKNHFASLYNVLDLTMITLYTCSLSIRAAILYRSLRDQIREGGSSGLAFFLGLIAGTSCPLSLSRTMLAAALKSPKRFRVPGSGFYGDFWGMLVNYSFDYFHMGDNFELLARGDDHAMFNYYWLNADRFYWDGRDPQHVAEGIFAIANVLTFSRISYILPVNEMLGPLQISLGKMIYDISRFTAIFLMVFFAFLLGLDNLFWYYNDSTRVHVELKAHESTRAGASFGSFGSALSSVFWGMFTMTDQNSIDLKPYEAHFTQDIASLLYGAYEVAIVIVLLNMLIAMMSSSFEQITTEADTEWKFARSKLFLEFIQEGSVLPAPLNLLAILMKPIEVSAYFVRSIYGYFFNRLSSDSDDDSVFQQEADLRRHASLRKNGEASRIVFNQTTAVADANVTIELPIKISYKEVVSRVVERFIFDVTTGEEGEGDNTKDEMADMRKDLTRMRRDVISSMTVQERELQGMRDDLANLASLLDLGVKNTETEISVCRGRVTAHAESVRNLTRAQEESLHMYLAITERTYRALNVLSNHFTGSNVAPDSPLSHILSFHAGKQGDDGAYDKRPDDV